jgi:hypothetical protein
VAALTSDLGIALTALAIVLATVVIAGLAPGRPPQPAVTAGTPIEATCLEWTDGCRVCRRELADGKLHCSTPGIACERQAGRCVRSR